MRRCTTRPLAFVLILLIAAGLACSISTTTVHLENAQITTAADSTTRARFYAPADTFFCRVDLKDAAKGTRVAAVWYVVPDDQSQPPTEISRREQTSGGGTLSFSLPAPPEGWTIGQYQVVLYLNDKKQQTLSFKVK
jgi:hypothetical protein